MRAIVVEEYGEVDQFQPIDIAVPTPTADEVLVEVFATSVNPIDWKIRAGYLRHVMTDTFPLIVGWDVSGVVKEVGKSVTKFQVGDEIFARADRSRPGALADYIVMKEELLVQKPQDVSFEEAATIPVAGLTAWQSLEQAQVQSGEKVLILGGAGGVGSFAIQFAKHLGATVTATTSGKNVEFVHSLGADIVINYESQNLEGWKFDAVLDTVGGDVLASSYEYVKPNGRLVTIAGQLNEKRVKEQGITAISYIGSPSTDQLGAIAKLVSQGKVDVSITEIFPMTLEGVRHAHLLSETGHAKGKIIVKVK